MTLSYFVDNGRFVAGSEDINLQWVYEAWGSSGAFCTNPSSQRITANPPVDVPPGLAPTTRVDLDNGSVRFDLRPTRGQLRVTWQKVELENSDIQYQWDVSGFTDGSVTEQRLTVTSDGLFKSCYRGSTTNTQLQYCGAGVEDISLDGSSTGPR